uniref:Uncharacterized protein n=1 Tax=Aureoumbra lagunensis TaxID=44058 RepID=A0A7S3JY21_9STRA|mmetsp:Transcript_18057/g.23550  ORF Transcript_18057/g.23550 Transcript_18057/m.23550 type:complete len:140 (+) Transcript_18057:93-512(+)|eukprot:CAMPEP_0197292040 /NCGR_PEP_ID=MMETSP0890-20130614/21028_1 /TAXON_ID=44058 ORGANISM="Aureoumbra lagunensis, Strain CCMP1510" /NCGR_SAMPLE_ID=MMETSP0890 /ASSEMBLY_ACC=CAM_ASM_000533 /LENGTH=139 /DNA_ID=CAMNT_0042765639 /DNA_START=38 /DNA_END=457 /DNA_ORIENTATION=-
MAEEEETTVVEETREPWFGKLQGAEKDELVISLSAILLEECGQDFSEERFQAVLKASGNEVAPYWIKVFSKALTKKGSLESFLPKPGGGGGGGGGGGAAADAAAPAAEEKKEEEEEEEEIDMGGGMDMFGEGGGDGDDY